MEVCRKTIKKQIIGLILGEKGYGRKTTQEYIHHLYIAYGSYCELEAQILLSIDLGYVKDESKGRVLAMAGEVERMLKALINSLETKAKTLEPCARRAHLEPWIRYKSYTKRGLTRFN